MKRKTKSISRRDMLRGGALAFGAALPGCVPVSLVTDSDSGGNSSSTSGSSSTQAASGSIGNPDCVLTPELTEGPYYIDVDMLRSDITEDRDGVLLALTAVVVEAGTCNPISDVVFEIWHADALGVYSGFRSEGTTGETYLRGAQLTDSTGSATIQTIYPGWYRGRAVHIHAKVHLSSSNVVTTQFFFPDDLTDQVYAANSPYNTRSGRDTLNSSDNIYPDTNSVLLDVVDDGNGGYAAAIVIAIDG